MLKTLWTYLSKYRKTQFWLLTILMILSSFLEIISLGAILPFLGALTAPEHFYNHQLMHPIVEILEINSPDQLLLPMTIIFIVAILISSGVRLSLLYLTTRFSYSTGADLSIEIFRRTLFQEYSVHISRNSSEVINGIIFKTNIITGGVILPVLTLITSIFLLISIITALLIINVKISLFSFLGFGLIYGFVILFTKTSVKNNSHLISHHSDQMVKTLQEGLGGIRDIIIDGKQNYFAKLYQDADLPYRNASGNNVFIGAFPRYAIEAIGMALIAGISYIMTQPGANIVEVIPLLGALALGAQRLLPALQNSYVSYTTIKGSQASFNDILSLLKQELPDFANLATPNPTPFNNEIRLEKLSFRYNENSPWVLKDISLSIKKNQCIGFIGTTGKGKSTLLDIIMGLLSPTSGDLRIDDKLVNKSNAREWQARIAHVPQTIYLSDSSIEENIAFGIPLDLIDQEQVRKAAQIAQIEDLINTWEDGYKTRVGERGVKISGGQRQRIGIARAIYKKVDVLILDEATSALDFMTEQAVMRSIIKARNNLTILVIAHRLTTLKECDMIVKLESENQLSLLNYEEIKG